MANRYMTQFFWSFHKMPAMVNCNFVVDPSNGNGLGNRSLKGPGLLNVFMNSTAAFTATYNNSVNLTGIASGTATLQVGMPVQGSGIPAGSTIASIVSSSAITISAATTGGATTGSVTYQAIGSPNPAAGIILVQFQDNWPAYIAGFDGFVSPVTGGNLTTVTAGDAYVIVSLGTATTAQWVAKGFPVGATPAVGAAFVASASGTIGGSAAVKLSGVSGITSIEAIGDPGLTLDPPGAKGGSMVLQCLGATDSATTTLIPTAPAPGSVVGLSFIFNNSTAPGGKAGPIPSF